MSRINNQPSGISIIASCAFAAGSSTSERAVGGNGLELDMRAVLTSCFAGIIALFDYSRDD